MEFDLSRLADRIRAAADRAGGLKVTVSGFDLILSKEGYGTNRSEAVSFAAMFLRDDDCVAQALDRLESTTDADGASDALSAGSPLQ